MKTTTEYYLLSDPKKRFVTGVMKITTNFITARYMPINMRGIMSYKNTTSINNFNNFASIFTLKRVTIDTYKKELRYFK